MAYSPERGGTGPARVLHLLAPARFGGLEQVVQALAATQARAGYEVHVAAVLEPESAESVMLQDLEADGVHTYALVLPPRRYARERHLVRELCRTLSPHVVHTHGSRSDVLHAPVARRLGIPTVSTTHGFTGGGWKNRFYERLQRRSLRRSEAVVAVSVPMADMLAAAGVDRGRLHCIPNGWVGGVDFLERSDARRALQLPESGFCAGFIGRLSPEKGPDLFLEALALVPGDMTAALIGDGVQRAELEQRAVELRLAGRIRWTGVVANAARLLRAFDVVVLSSRTEGTPVVLLEAMAAGVPVVAARVGGIPYVVSKEEALLVPPGDPAELAEAIGLVMTDGGAAARRAARAQERLLAERGGLAWLRQYEQVYRACGVGVPRHGGGR